jgi:hypothetical protein
MSVWREDRMKTYWDLSEAERGELTQDEVQKYVDAELMLKGVLKVKPLVLDPEPTVPEPTTAVYVVRHSRYHEFGAAFDRIEDAKAFVGLKPKRLESHWLGSESVQAIGVSPEPEIVEVRVYGETELVAIKGELQRASAVRAGNKRREEEFEKAKKANDEALKGLWEDWTRCRDYTETLRGVAETFVDYQRTAGDDALASKFLRKVYDGEVIAEAAERYKLPISVAADEAAQ